MVAALTLLTLLASYLRPGPVWAEEAEEPAIVDRSLVVSAWQLGGAQVRQAAEAALVGSDAQALDFLNNGWRQAALLDERDAVAEVISDGGPSVRAAAQQAMDAADAGDPEALASFLADGWQGPADIDARVSVNQLMANGGPQVQEAAQQALDSENPEELRKFLDSGWQAQWETDQRLRVNQAMATGGANVKAAAQKALDAGTPEALEAFLSYGWAVAAARDEETETLTDLLAQTQAAGDLAAQETQQAKEEGERAAAAANAARQSAQAAAAATEAARNDMAQAAAHAKRAAAAANKAAQAAKTAVQAAAAASRAARAAASAAARAASAAARAGQAASDARKAAAAAARDKSKADAASQAAVTADLLAGRAREFAYKVQQTSFAIDEGKKALAAAKLAVKHAKEAADANDQAAIHAKTAGADASAAIAAAREARANADRAARAVAAAEKYLQITVDAAVAARAAALRAATHAEAAAQAARHAAEHAGEAAQAATRATEHANAATEAANAAVEAAGQAAAVYEAAREADRERLAVATDQALEDARKANTEYEAQQRLVDWDVEQAAQRDAETNRLIGVARDPATSAAEAVAAGRQVALNLATGVRGVWTRQAARVALGGRDEQVLEFVRTGLDTAAAQDDRQAVMDLAITDNVKLAAAAQAALAGDDATVTQFLRTQNYPGRYTDDRLKVNQIMAAARKAGDVVLMQEAQKVLDAGSLQAFRDFLDTGQYRAAAIGERVRVNQVMADPESGDEVKAAAQVALDGPPTGLAEFLNTGRYPAAERDYETMAHLAAVGGLLEKINATAETAVRNALEAQEVAARARNDASLADSYAQQAQASANKAQGYAAKAANYANQAAQSVEKAAAAVKTAKSAATRANASAHSALRSAAWATLSHQSAVKAATEARAAAERARQSAIDANEDLKTAAGAAQQAYDRYIHERGLEIQRCAAELHGDAGTAVSRLLGRPDNEFSENCVRNVLGDPEELATRAYVNASFCTIFPQGGQHYSNCINSTLDPTFRGMHSLTTMVAFVQSALVMLTPVAASAAIGCVATVACGAVVGGIFTLGEVGLNLFKLVNGDQSLAETALNLGKVALEALLMAGVAKLLSAGFRAIKATYVAIRNAKLAQAELRTINIVKLNLEGLSSCLTVRHSFDPSTPVLMADGSHRPISEIAVGDHVTATDPASGRTSSEPVTKVWTNRDTALADVQVTEHSGTASTIQATANHPFWSTASQSWVAAGELSPGSQLRTSSGMPATVTSVRSYRGAKVMYDLTVAKIHTYYVVAGATPALVHNNNAKCGTFEDVADGLPVRPKDEGPTTGQVVNVTVNGVTPLGKQIKSGEDELSGIINEFLKKSPDVEMPSSGPYAAASHVEAKVAWFMKEHEVKYAVVVINNVKGPCSGKYSCENAVGAILCQGSTLLVKFQDANGVMTEVPLKGRRMCPKS